MIFPFLVTALSALAAHASVRFETSDMLVRGSTNPTSSAVSAPTGAIYWGSAGPAWKTDGGYTTNWRAIEDVSSAHTITNKDLTSTTISGLDNTSARAGKQLVARCEYIQISNKSNWNDEKQCQFGGLVGDGTGTTSYAGNDEGNHPGTAVRTLPVNGSAAISASYGSMGFSVVWAGGGTTIIEMLYLVPSLSATGSLFEAFIGFCSTSSSCAADNSVTKYIAGVVLPQAAGSSWACVVENYVGGMQSEQVSSGYAQAANVWTKVRLTIGSLVSAAWSDANGGSGSCTTTTSAKTPSDSSNSTGMAAIFKLSHPSATFAVQKDLVVDYFTLLKNLSPTR